MTELDKADTEETDMQTRERSRYRILFIDDNVKVCATLSGTEILLGFVHRA